MKTLLLAAAVLVTATAGLRAAGPPVDAEALASWPSIADEQISEDGRYVAYAILAGEEPAGLELVSTDARWRKSLPAARSAEFVCEPAGKCGLLAFQDRRGELNLVRLGGDRVEGLGSVESYELPARGARRWLAYRSSRAPSQLRIRNLSTGRELRYDGVAGFQFSEEGRALLLRVASQLDSGGAQSLQWLDPDGGGPITIWQGGGAGGAVFDEAGRQLAFMVQEPGDPAGSRSIWHYTAGARRAVRIVDEKTAGLDTGLRLHEVTGFTEHGRTLRVELMRMPPVLEPLPSAVDVDIWSHHDERLQSQQLADLAAGRSERVYAAQLDIATRVLTRLEGTGDTLGDSAWNVQVGEVALVDHRAGDPDRGEYHWNPAARLSTELLYFRDGRRIPVSAWDLPDESRPQLSPDGRFVVQFDPVASSFSSHDVSTGVVRGITAGAATDWRRFDASWLPRSSPALRGIAGWVEGDVAVLLYDAYDVWLVDLLGATAPVNLTNGYGRRHQTIFSLRAQVPPRQRIYRRDERLILAAFDRVTRKSGFFATRLEGGADPVRLTMGAYAYYRPEDESGMPVKAARAAKYLVRRESATESANLFATDDFRTFTRLSHLQPEQQHNWLTAELVDWHGPDGTVAQGILYKPGDFDPARRYPVLFNYYEVASDDLNVYPIPKPLRMGCEIDIASYVTRGYLVIRPDIHYAPGKLRESAVRAVVSAAGHLRQMPWVDGKRMGLQGCSFGGIATNSIVTSTGLFAAAVSASGIADLISAYGALWLPNARAGTSGGASLQRMAEIGQERMNSNLWEHPGLFVENSAIFHVDRVSTPILLMHTRDDAICPFANAVEFFTGLRRLGKPAWMLQYNEGNHQLEGAPAKDFAMRMAQFFDHYLKGAPPPRWMTRGVPASLKGFDSGLGLDIGAAGSAQGE